MKAEVTENRRTGRIEKLTMEAESFQEERILRLLIDGMMDEKIHFHAILEDGTEHGFGFGSGKRIK